MKNSAILALLAVFLALPVFGQTKSPFADTTYTFGLTPVTLPGQGQTLAGAETDIMIGITPNNSFGQSTLISSAPFVGGRYDRTIPQVGKWIQDHTALTGFNFQAYLTGSLGIVKATQTHWGERVGMGIKWAPSGAQNFSVAFEVQANNLPGISHWIPSLCVSPQFRF